MTVAGPTGDELVEMLGALANPLRLRIVATLASGRDYVSRLAREIGVSRPLLHMHLQRLEAAGLVAGTLELSEDGKAMKYSWQGHRPGHRRSCTWPRCSWPLSCWPC